MMPFGTSMNARRIGRAASAVSAGVMASNMGSARVAAAPRRKARRGMCFLAIDIADPPHLKLRALDDPEYDRRPTMAGRRGGAPGLAKDRQVRLLLCAPQGA